MPNPKQAKRTFEMTLDIPAVPEDVWECLTVAESYERWFAPKAQIEPGPGGEIRARWPNGYPNYCRRRSHFRRMWWETMRGRKLTN